MEQLYRAKTQKGSRVALQWYSPVFQKWQTLRYFNTEEECLERIAELTNFSEEEGLYHAAQ